MDWIGLGLNGDGGVNVSRGVALRVTVALGSRLNCMCVQAGLYERHLLEHECERMRGWGEGAMLRAMILKLGGYVGWGVDRASFWNHGVRRVATCTGKNH
jgi:hypothetical protein